MAKDQARNMKDLVPYEFYPFASFVAHRPGGEWKRHKSIGSAKNAANQSWLYEPNKQRSAVYSWDADTESWIGVDA